MDILFALIDMGLLLAGLVGGALTYMRYRGHGFGVVDLLIFGGLAVVADGVCLKLFHAVSGPHADSAAYGALAAMLLLLGLVPVAAGLTLVAAMAAAVCLERYPLLRHVALALVLAAGAAYLFMGNLDEMEAPGGALNNDRLAGEHWALESGASTRADCDRQSRAVAFRKGCYAALRR